MFDIGYFGVTDSTLTASMVYDPPVLHHVPVSQLQRSDPIKVYDESPVPEPATQLVVQKAVAPRKPPQESSRNFHVTSYIETNETVSVEKP